jgi:phage repressor protein C with HTH and peptisase S24 domain
MYNLNSEDAHLLLTQLNKDEYDEFLFSCDDEDNLLEELE